MQAVKKGMMKEAMKNAGYVDYVVNNVPFGNGTNTGLALLAQIPTGSGIKQRVGARIKWKSIQIRGVVYGGSSTASGDRVSIQFIYDRKPGAGIATYGEIYATTPTADSLVNDNNRDRFLVLKRIDTILTGDSTNATGEGFKMVDEYFKLKGLEAEYSGAQYAAGPPIVGDGGFGDIRTGAIYIVLAGHRTNDISGVVPAKFAGTVRTRFADIQN